jgi:hypothetical protein
MTDFRISGTLTLLVKVAWVYFCPRKEFYPRFSKKTMMLTLVLEVRGYYHKACREVISIRLDLGYL